MNENHSHCVVPHKPTIRAVIGGGGGNDWPVIGGD